MTIELEIHPLEDALEQSSKALARDNLPVYYKYRYTFSRDEQDLDCQKSVVRSLIKFISSRYMLGHKMTVGIEHYTKGMLVAKPHVHIHFMSRDKSDTIRHALAREFNMIGRCQSCKAEVLVDEDKFWRYPLKQQKGDTYRFSNVLGESGEWLKNQIEIAYSCWKQSAEVNIKAMEKKVERSSRDRLFQYLDNIDYVSESQLCISAYKYYVEYEDTFNYNTVDGYVHAYMLKKKYISYEEFYKRKH